MNGVRAARRTRWVPLGSPRHWRVPLGRGERLAVMALAAFLPAGFRTRQRGEWTADLVELAAAGAGRRWRYVLGALWTLPALRAAARRDGVARSGAGPSRTVDTSSAGTALARVLLLGLGWPVVSWLVAVPARYFLLDIPGRLAAADGPLDPKDMWPGGWLFWLLLPVIAAVTLGAYVAMAGGPLLASALGFSGVAVGVTQRRANGRLRATVSIAGVTVLVAVLLGISSSVSAGTGDPSVGRTVGTAALPAARWYGWLFAVQADRGYTAALLGVLAIVLALRASSLTRRSRTALLFVGTGAFAVLLAHHTATGSAMHTWFLD